MNRQRLQRLIGITHRHGMETESKIKELQRRLAGLVALNARRRAALNTGKPITMYDSVTVSSIPHDAEAVAGYVNGKYANMAEMRKRFPRAYKLAISVFASLDEGDCLDLEKGDATPVEAPGWVKKRLRAGVWRPALYADTSTMPQVVIALLHAGIALSQVRLFVADWTNRPHIPQGYEACQYESDESRDISLCHRSFFEGA